MVRSVGCLLVGLAFFALAEPIRAQRPAHQAVPDSSSGVPDTLAPEETPGSQQPDPTLTPWEAPSFSFKSEDGNALSLASTAVEARIAGVVADLTIRKRYVYRGQYRLRKARFGFSPPASGTLHKATIRVGDRTIRARTRDPTGAVKLGDDVRGGTDFTFFQVDVRDLRPGDTVRVRVQYTDVLTPENGEYEIAFSNGAAPDVPGSLNDEEEPASNAAFAFDATLSAGMSIRDISVPSHDARVDFADSTRARITLVEPEGSGSPFVLRYRLAGPTIASGLLLYEGREENFFLATMQPPNRMADGDGPAREYIFVVDRLMDSGTRRRGPTNQAMNAVRHLIREVVSPLRSSDQFNVMTPARLADSSTEHVESDASTSATTLWADRSRRATEENLRAALRFVDRERHHPMNREAALRKTLSLPKEKNRSRSVVLISDDWFPLEHETVRGFRESLSDASVFTVDIEPRRAGFSVRRVAQARRTRPFHGIIASSTDAETAGRRLRRAARPVLSDVEVSYDKFEAYDVQPPSPPDLLAGRPAVVVGKWRGDPRGTVTLRGTRGDRLVERTMDVDTAPMDSTHVGLRALWGRRQADALSFRSATAPNEESNVVEHIEETEKALTRLGLRYDLLTRYTPIIALDGSGPVVGLVGGQRWAPSSNARPDVPACRYVARPLRTCVLMTSPMRNCCVQRRGTTTLFDLPGLSDRLKKADPLVVEPGTSPPYGDPGTSPITGSPTRSTDEKMVRLPGGAFIMGLTDEDSLDLQDAGRRTVAVSSFSVDRHEVTNAEYRTFLDSLSHEARKQRRPDSTVWTDVPIDVPWHTYFYGEEWSDHPVVGVTWADARAYCRAAGKRLPTEAEWEYAARGGRVGRVYPWAGLSPRDDQGQYRANFAPRDTARSADGYAFTAPVGSYSANPWHLYDVAGNVAEWVRDAYASDYSVYEPKADSKQNRGPRDPIRDPVYEDSTATRRVVRGGSWASNAFEIGVGVRDAQAKDHASARIGFRCAAGGRSAEGEAETNRPRSRPREMSGSSE